MELLPAELNANPMQQQRRCQGGNEQGDEEGEEDKEEHDVVVSQFSSSFSPCL